jgi:hypothetical protein
MTDITSFLSSDPLGALKITLTVMMLIGSIGFLPERIRNRFLRSPEVNHALAQKTRRARTD